MPGHPGSRQSAAAGTTTTHTTTITVTTTTTTIATTGGSCRQKTVRGRVPPPQKKRLQFLDFPENLKKKSLNSTSSLQVAYPLFRRAERDSRGGSAAPGGEGPAAGQGCQDVPAGTGGFILLLFLQHSEQVLSRVATPGPPLCQGRRQLRRQRM